MRFVFFIPICRAFFKGSNGEMVALWLRVARSSRLSGGGGRHFFCGAVWLGVF
jgi:hypothetical protein